METLDERILTTFKRSLYMAQRLQQNLKLKIFLMFLTKLGCGE